MKLSRARLLLSVALLAPAAVAVLTGPSPAQAGTAFSNQLLLGSPSVDGVTTAPHAGSSGDSEPALAFSSTGRLAVDGLAWLPFQVNLWSGSFGQPPTYLGGLDSNLQGKGHGRTTLGDEDADMEFTSAGTLLVADLNLSLNSQWKGFQLGLDIDRCPSDATSLADCTQAYVDTAGADRPWITTAGRTAWVSYHDSRNSGTIRVQRSDDDGVTWSPVGSPIAGQGNATGDATYNNQIGPIVADAGTGNVFQVYAAGEPQTKAKIPAYNNLFVSRSTDRGKHWTAVRVVHTPPGTRLNGIFPSLAVDSVTHALWTTWTDLHGVRVSSSTDAGQTWSAPQTVSTATTTVMPWVAARNGKVDVVYYGSSAASTDDASAVWNAYDSQLQGGAWGVKLVSNSPNRVGKVCITGSACADSRQLLDLFEVAEDPVSGKAAIIYTDSTIDTWSDSSTPEPQQLPEIVLAFEQ